MEKPIEQQESEIEIKLKRMSYISGFDNCTGGNEKLISYFDSKRLNSDFRTNAFIRGVEDAVSMGESSIADIIDFNSALLDYYPLPGPLGDVYAKCGDTFEREGADYQIVDYIKTKIANPGAIYIFAIRIDSGDNRQIEFDGKEVAELLLKSNSK